MPSQTDLLNGALGLCGANRITGIDDGTINANHCKVFYPPLLDATLRMAHWNFAVGRANLSPSVTPPLFEWAYAYPLPADNLKLREYNGGTVNASGLVLWDGRWLRLYVIESGKLLSNEATPSIVYTRRETDPNMWAGDFYQYIMYHLGSYLANAIPKDTKKAESLLGIAMKTWLPWALAADGQEGTVVPMQVDDLTWGR